MSQNINQIRKISLAKQSKLKKKVAIPIVNKLLETKYVYLFDWLGVPTIQFPNDLIVMQELIYKYKPDFIIETGVAHGGSLLFYASILKLIKKKFKVIGVDIFIKVENKKRIKKNSLSKNIILIETSSTNINTLKKLKKITKGKKTLIVLDSNHSHKHVIQEMDLYSSLIKKNGYMVVMDTTTEFVKSKHINKNRNFGKGNNPYTAVKSFIKYNKKFKIDKLYENKSFITGCFNGFLKKIS